MRWLLSGLLMGMAYAEMSGWAPVADLPHPPRPLSLIPTRCPRCVAAQRALSDYWKRCGENFIPSADRSGKRIRFDNDLRFYCRECDVYFETGFASLVAAIPVVADPIRET